MKPMYDYYNQQIDNYKTTIGTANGCEYFSAITNPIARKCQGKNEVGTLIIDGMTIVGHIANGLGYGMTRANLLQLRQEIDSRSILRGNYSPSERQQIAEIDKMIDECRKRSNNNIFLGTCVAACLFGAGLTALIKNNH